MLLPDTLSPLYRMGIEEFLDFAFCDFDDEDELSCPCKKCHFSEYKNKDEMRADLLGYGMMIHDALGHPDDNPFDKDDMSDDINISSNSHKEPKKPSLTHEQFEKLIKDAEQQLFLGKLKDYVRNKARPEGSIAEGYILEECLFFCSKYLHNVETKSNQQERNSDSVSDDYEGLSIFAPSGVPLGKENSKCLTQEEWEKARDYVLKNCDEVQPFLREYEQGQNENEFSEWFRERVNSLPDKHTQVLKDLRSLSFGPLMGVERYNGYLANGFRFHIKALEERRTNQNSGILVEGASDARNLDYYGVLTEIISLQYLDGKRVVLFNSHWWDVSNFGKGIKVDKHNIVSVNTKRKLQTHEPFVLACQAQQVFYVRDGFDPNWLVAIRTQARHSYDVVLV
uniref:DUF4218 domain-containing protein n=1 Tax=Chenopodium quinoa TaxID=63459 RepID=A0A803NAU5_CHEQI